MIKTYPLCKEGHYAKHVTDEIEYFWSLYFLSCICMESVALASSTIITIERQRIKTVRITIDTQFESMQNAVIKRAGITSRVNYTNKWPAGKDLAFLNTLF